MADQARFTSGVAPDTLTARDLDRAIGGGELGLHYQPIVNLVDETVTGFEALVRWNHPDLGTICAARFVPLAERSGLIGAVDAWVLDAACRQLAAWQEDVLVGPGFRIAMNVSGSELDGGGIVARVRHAVVTSGVDPQSLVIEVTETCAIPSFAAAQRSVDGLHALGIEVSLDDFGSHHANFTRLHSLAFDVLEIDRTFVVDADTERGQSIVRTLIELGGHLQARVIAEGIETLDQAVLLETLGCDEGQGFRWAPGLSGEQAEELLALGLWPLAEPTAAWCPRALCAA
jgi:EAL domain-containing protein (putative c-di-GMP-specific phosphodiesterase class I)